MQCITIYYTLYYSVLQCTNCYHVYNALSPLPLALVSTSWNEDTVSTYNNQCGMVDRVDSADRCIARQHTQIDGQIAG